LDANPEIASSVEGRLERLGLSAEETDQQAGLLLGTVSAIGRQSCRFPRGNALRRLPAAFDVSEEFLLGLEPGDLIPAEMLEESQGELGLLAPDEEALLRHYRRLDISTRAAVVQLVSRAAGPDPKPEVTMLITQDGNARFAEEQPGFASTLPLITRRRPSSPWFQADPSRPIPALHRQRTSRDLQTLSVS
jgi:hypothetical protein